MSRGIGRVCAGLLIAAFAVTMSVAALYTLQLTNSMIRTAEKARVIEYVNENADEIMKAIDSGDFSKIESSGVVKEVKIRDGCYDFYCGGSGFGSETSYYGFFYSYGNNMLGVWCAPSYKEVLKPYGNGYLWEEPRGDNGYYVEPICKYIFYYEEWY